MVELWNELVRDVWFVETAHTHFFPWSLRFISLFFNGFWILWDRTCYRETWQPDAKYDVKRDPVGHWIFTFCSFAEISCSYKPFSWCFCWTNRSILAQADFNCSRIFFTDVQGNSWQWMSIYGLLWIIWFVNLYV